MGGGTMIVLITPTGARAAQLRLCAEWMRAQTYTGKVAWLIIDDAVPRTSNFITEEFRTDWQIHKLFPAPAWTVGQNTQGRNIAVGIQFMQQQFKLKDVEGIFIIEDDDYYSPQYLTEMVKRLDGYQAAGEMYTVYYNVAQLGWVRNGNDWWSSLFQTCFTPAALPLFTSLYGCKFIDYEFFKLVQSKNLFSGYDYGVGIKGQAGRAGIGAGHHWTHNMTKDADGSKLIELIGNDAHKYLTITK